MKTTLLILSLLVGSFTQAKQSQGNCSEQQARVLSCSVEGGNFSVDLCTVNAGEANLATSEGQVLKAERKQNRGDLVVYGAKGTTLEIMSPTGSGNQKGIIQSGANQLLRATCQWHNYNMD